METYLPIKRQNIQAIPNFSSFFYTRRTNFRQEKINITFTLDFKVMIFFLDNVRIFFLSLSFLFSLQILFTSAGILPRCLFLKCSTIDSIMNNSTHATSRRNIHQRQKITQETRRTFEVKQHRLSRNKSFNFSFKLAGFQLNKNTPWNVLCSFPRLLSSEKRSPLLYKALISREPAKLPWITSIRK